MIIHAQLAKIRASSVKFERTQVPWDIFSSEALLKHFYISSPVQEALSHNI